jgi:hypothetical protein
LDRTQKKNWPAYIKKGWCVLDQRIKEHIQVADWPEITRKLSIYASRRANLVFKVKSDQAVLPMGFSVASVVQESIMKLLDGTRNWNPDNVDLLGFLMGVVKSEIGHLLDLKETSLSTPIDSENAEKYQNESLNPEQGVIEKENNKLLEIAHQKLIEQAESNPEYETVALCLMSGIYKPRDIVQETGLDVREVYKIKKRWQKDFEKILREVLAEAN